MRISKKELKILIENFLNEGNDSSFYSNKIKDMDGECYLKFDGNILYWFHNDKVAFTWEAKSGLAKNFKKNPKNVMHIKNVGPTPEGEYKLGKLEIADRGLQATLKGKYASEYEEFKNPEERKKRLQQWNFNTKERTDAFGNFRLLLIPVDTKQDYVANLSPDDIEDIMDDAESAKPGELPEDDGEKDGSYDLKNKLTISMGNSGNDVTFKIKETGENYKRNRMLIHGGKEFQSAGCIDLAYGNDDFALTYSAWQAASGKKTMKVVVDYSDWKYQISGDRGFTKF